MAAASADFLYAVTLPPKQNGFFRGAVCMSEQNCNKEDCNEYYDCLLKTVLDSSSSRSTTSYDVPIEILEDDDQSSYENMNPNQTTLCHPGNHCNNKRQTSCHNNKLSSKRGDRSCEFGDKPKKRHEKDDDTTVTNDECSGTGKDRSEPLDGDHRRVHFGHVEIREYSITVGDHPSCRDSCPLTLEWKHTSSVKKNISQPDDDGYDAECQPKSQRRGGHCRPSSPPLNCTANLIPRKVPSSPPPQSPRRLSLRERRERISHVRGLKGDCQAILELEFLRAHESYERDHANSMAIERQYHSRVTALSSRFKSHEGLKPEVDSSATVHRRVAGQPIKKSKLRHNDEGHHHPCRYQQPGHHHHHHPPAAVYGRPGPGAPCSIPPSRQVAPPKPDRPWQQVVFDEWRASYYNRARAATPEVEARSGTCSSGPFRRVQVTSTAAATTDPPRVSTPPVGPPRPTVGRSCRRDCHFRFY